MIDKHCIKLIPRDLRCKEEKDKEIDFHKVYGVAPVKWIPKAQSDWKRVTQRNQATSSSCVDHSWCEVAEAQTGQILSAHPPYSVRPNKPQEGSIPLQALQSLVSIGTTTEQLCPSNGLSEDDMDAPVSVPTPIKIPKNGIGGIQIDMDHLASAIQQHKGVILSFDLSWREWEANLGMPSIIPNVSIDGGHELSALDFIMFDNKKCIVAQNHWGANDTFSIGNSGQVILTEEYILARCTSAYYSLPPIKSMQKPQHTFVINLSMGRVGTDILALQQCLNFDSDTQIASSGLGSPGQETSLFGMLTLSAVKKFQHKYHIPETGFVGPLTRAQLNAMFGQPYSLKEAIIQTESEGYADAVGDNGNAYGIFQIWDSYMEDALPDHKAIECLGNTTISEQAFDAYMARYATPELLGRPVTDEDIARIHNAGPNGWKKDGSSLDANASEYWKKVQLHMVA